MSGEVGLEKSPVVDLHICIEIAIEQYGFLFARMNNFKSNVSNHSLGRCQIQKIILFPLKMLVLHLKNNSRTFLNTFFFFLADSQLFRQQFYTIQFLLDLNFEWFQTW